MSCKVHTVEETTQTIVEEAHDSSIHYSKDEIDDYEQSQAKFRELWERKREKVRTIFQFPNLSIFCPKVYPREFYLLELGELFRLACCFQRSFEDEIFSEGSIWERLLSLSI